MPLFRKVNEELLVKMLLHVKILEKSWIRDEVERGACYLPAAVFSDDDVQALLRLKMTGGKTLQQGFDDFIAACVEKKSHVCTKHGVLPFYVKAFFGDRETMHDVAKKHAGLVDKLQRRLLSTDRSASCTSPAPPLPEPRLDKKEKQAEKAARKRRKLEKI